MTTSDDPPGSEWLLCDYCTPRRSPVDGRTFRDCDWCSARLWPVWCECTYCEWIEETRMTQPIDDDEYAEDAASVPDEDLPEPTEPSQIPPDQGDAGAAK